MKRTSFKAWTILFSLVWFAPPEAQGAARSKVPCLDQPPTILHLGIPYRLVDPPSSRDQLISEARAALGPAFRQENLTERSSCSGSRRFQLNISLGTDYEVLDWMSQGEVDGGLVSPLALWLLRQEGVDVLEVAKRERDGLDPDAIRFTAWLRQGDDSVGCGNAQLILDGYRRHLFCRALEGISEKSRLPPQESSSCLAPTPTPGADLCRSRLAEGIGIRPVLPDHLSTAGFLLPMSSNSLWLEEELAAMRRRNPNLSEKFQEALFSGLRDGFWRGWTRDMRLTLDHDPLERATLQPAGGAADPLELPTETGAPPQDRIEILFSGRPQRHSGGQHVLEPSPWGHLPGIASTGVPLGGDAQNTAPDRWIFLHGSVHALFPRPDHDHKELSQGGLVPPAFAGLFGRGEAEDLPRWADREKSASGSRGGLRPLPPALGTLLEVNSRFGVRTLAFTSDEILRLLRGQNRDASVDQRLALVLPGGGVKSAYQAILLDRLYGAGLLRNFLTPPASIAEDPPAPDRALPVHEVIGTSGGALTGYFVAQLGPKGPFELTEILWHRGRPGEEPCAEGEADGEATAGAPRRSKPLRSKDVFGFTDIARYLSLVYIFGLFCVPLTVLVWRQRMRQERSDSAYPARRTLASLSLGAVLILPPLLIQLVAGGGYREHVPEIEGIFYMLMVLLIMMADQCLVVRPGRQPVKYLITWRIPVVAGSLLILLPLGLRILLSLRYRLTGAEAQGFPQLLSQWLVGERANVGSVFLLLLLVAVLGGLALPLRLQQKSWTGDWRSFSRPLLETLVCGAFSLLVLGVPGLLGIVHRVPLLVWVLGLVALIWAMYSRLSKRSSQTHRSWRPLYFSSLTAASALTLMICVPSGAGGSNPIATLLRPSALDAFGGHLSIAVGGLLLAAGIIQALVEKNRAYDLENVGSFMAALVVVFGHVITVLGTLIVLEWFLAKFSLPGASWFTTLELDWHYWVTASALALGFGVLLLKLACRPCPGPFCQRLRAAVDYLVESHPNRPMISLRAFRLALLALLSVLWWNLLLAPALYGNRQAKATLARTIDRFDTSYACAHGLPLDADQRPQAKPIFGAYFVTPANELEEDGTRFFLFTPQGDIPCPEVPERSRSGSQWLPYRLGILQSPADAEDPELLVVPATSAEERRCPLLTDQDFLQDVIFASGSPFPIFAPHRVQEPVGRRRELILVDGGYSNNVPVEAAHGLEARQVLVLRSSHPAPVESSSWIGRALGNLTGPLVKNLPRLPSFLFERSQQVDRLSSQDLFVVSLAPLPEHKAWPALYHFQKAVVERMEETAEADLKERIGFVESWGRPETRFILELTEEPAAPKPPLEGQLPAGGSAQEATK